MLVGVPKEIKTQENRVGLTPESVRELIRHGHKVLVQTNAGMGISIVDEDYRSVGAQICATAEDIFARADMIVKVKEPQPEECLMLRPGQVIFTYLHLAPDPIQAKLLLNSGCIAIAYETVTSHFGTLPLLMPMSQVAGRMSIQAGAHCLEMSQGGRGVLLGGVPGVAPAKVTVIGGGIVGTNAARVAMGMEAEVTILDTSLERLRELDFQFGGKLNTIFSTASAIEDYVRTSDLVIGAVLLPGAAAPKLVTRNMVRQMPKGSVIVDVAIDQGGCVEGSRPTTHQEPTYVEDNVVHYCVANMPGALPRTSTFALNNATLPFVIALANKGAREAMMQDPHLLNGLNIYEGRVTYQAVAEALNQDYIPATEAINN